MVKSHLVITISLDPTKENSGVQKLKPKLAKKTKLILTYPSDLARFVKIRSSLPADLREELISFLKKSVDVFA